jgi:antirestriction protein ArdC
MSVNVYEVINTHIMDLLQQGTVPWKKLWNSALAEVMVSW